MTTKERSEIAPQRKNLNEDTKENTENLENIY